MQPSPAATETGRMKILIVEDDESTAEAMAFHMRAAGLEPTVAADGLAGLRALRTSAPDAVVLDLMLPGVNGWHIIRQAREWAPRLPIIVVTARTNEHDRVEVLALGADDVMAKPFSMRELLARVSAALRRTAVEAAGSDHLPVAEGELSIDPERMSVLVAGRPADLDPARVQAALDPGGGPRARPLARRDLPAGVGRGARPRRPVGRRAGAPAAAQGGRGRRRATPTSRPSTGSATAS